MANTTISPNMGMPIPVVSTDPGPDWANNVNASLNIIDSHNHTSGEGVQITPGGLNISSDLTFQSNNATNLRSSRYAAQNAPINGSADLGCTYVSGADLYYNDTAGNQVRITASGAIAGSNGTISGLPSGTASAAFAGSTFTWQSATSTPANMNCGPITIGTNTVSPKTVTIAPNGAQAANYTLTWPAASPAGAQVLLYDASGNATWLSSFIASSSFTVTLSGVVGVITQTWYYSVSNNHVIISPAAATLAFTKNGVSGTVGISGIPSTILPSSSTLNAVCYLSTNGGAGYQAALLQLTSTGGALFSDMGSDNIAGNASCVLSGANFSYLVRS